MKAKIIHGNLLTNWQMKFHILFHEPEFGFKADEKLIAYILSSLQLEQTFSNHSHDHHEHCHSIIPLNVISNALYFIDKGEVHVYHQESKHMLVTYEEGSYFGDISYLFKARNQYRF